MTDTPLHCYHCGEQICGFFCLEVLKKGTPNSTNLPEEAIVCKKCHDAHPEREYTSG